MQHALKHIWHTAREYLTHWMVAGLIVAATGVAPEHWMTHLVHDLHIPTDALHLWAAEIDLRWLLLAAGLTLVVGDIAWRRTRPAAVIEPAPVAQPASAAEALTLPDKPSIAVLPFDNLSGDPEQEYFSDGVAEDIITELSRSRALFVIARNSSFTYRGRVADVKQIARELGVRYVLKGSVRREGDRIRVTAQLIEADSGNHIWAERYDRDQQSVFAIQDEITQAVATAIRPAVADAEMHRAMRRSPKSLGAWDLYQQGMWHLAKMNLEGNDAARGLFERAVELDPMFAAAHVGLSRTYQKAGAQYLTMSMDEAIRLASMHARNAVQLDPGDADALAELSWTLVLQGDQDSALTTARQALAINPSCAPAYRTMGSVLMNTGRPVDGRQALRAFERLSPRDANITAVHRQIAISYYYERDYDRCVEVARRDLSANPGLTLIYRWLAAALGQLARTEEARAALEKSIAISPHEFEVYVHNRVTWMRPEDYEHMLEGLRKAGWQG